VENFTAHVVGEPTTLREKRWLELYTKQMRAKPSDNQRCCSFQN
jgi:hypothetical protein